MKGTYVLLIRVPRETKVKIGSLGRIRFKKEAYAYVGSALKNMKSRIERHLKDEKNFHWHIDYFLTKADIEEIIYGEKAEKKECEIAETLADKFPSIKDFGSSDCECKSHLFRFEDFPKLKEEVISSFKKAGLEPEEW